MRLRRHDLLRLTLFTGVATLIVGIELSIGSERGKSPSAEATARSLSSVSENRRSEGGLELKAETKRELGVFRLGEARKSRISTAETVDGIACLFEETDEGTGSSCLEGGLFALRKVEFLVSTQGGPELFTALRVAGVAAPNVRSASLVKTDGTAVPLSLNSERAFVYESPSSELEARIYPTALRLYGGNRKPVETVTFPPAG